MCLAEDDTEDDTEEDDIVCVLYFGASVPLPECVKVVFFIHFLLFVPVFRALAGQEKGSARWSARPGVVADCKEVEPWRRPQAAGNFYNPSISTVLYQVTIQYSTVLTSSSIQHRINRINRRHRPRR